ncbi:MAG: fibronectin type III domain-containing protein, partial [Bacteroidia bacterium]|nr:fibronectin type III domain-containing protein [Bacteroidia bacterium]MDW8157675.1 fibronectin type III domain-containing protein [Bacteroidia bacterium]
LRIVMPAHPGEYTVENMKVIDARGCESLSAFSSFKYTVYPEVKVILMHAEPASCTQSNASIQLQAQGGVNGSYEYTLLSNGQTNTTGNFMGLGAGVHYIAVRSGECQIQKVFEIPSNGPPKGLSIIEQNGIPVARWQAVLGSRAYNLRYREVGSNMPFVAINSISATSALLTELLPNKTYEIQVQAVCIDGNSTSWSEVINYTLSSSCLAVPFLQVTSLNATTVSLQWNKVSFGAICYIISFGKIGIDPSLWQQVIVPYSRNTYILSGLEPGQAYGIRMRTNCQICSSTGGSFSTWSPIQIFTSTFRLAELTDFTESWLWPNPAQNGFWIHIANQKVQSITFYDLQGRLLDWFSTKGTLESSQEGEALWISTEKLNPGVYLIGILGENQARYMHRLIINR